VQVYAQQARAGLIVLNLKKWNNFCQLGSKQGKHLMLLIACMI